MIYRFAVSLYRDTYRKSSVSRYIVLRYRCIAISIVSLLYRDISFAVSLYRDKYRKSSVSRYIVCGIVVSRYVSLVFCIAKRRCAICRCTFVSEKFLACRTRSPGLAPTGLATKVILPPSHDMT